MLRGSSEDVNAKIDPAKLLPGQMIWQPKIDGISEIPKLTLLGEGGSALARRAACTAGGPLTLARRDAATLQRQGG